MIKLISVPLAAIHAFTEIWWIPFLFVAIAVLFSLYSYAYVYQFIWGEPNPKFPKWLPSLRSWGDSLFSFTCLIAIGIVLGVLSVAYVELTGDFSEYRFNRFVEATADECAWIGAIALTYCYHFKTLLAKRFHPKQPS